MVKTKLKKMGVLMVSAIITVASVLNVYAVGEGSGNIYKDGNQIGQWENYMEKQYARASTGEPGNATTYYKNTYMTVNIQSIYPYGGSHAYYVNATLDVNQSNKHNNTAFAEKAIPTTEYGTSAYTKHVIIVNGTAYTPAYNNGNSNLVKP